MARKIDAIQNGLITSIQADPVLGPLLTSPSKVAFWRELTFVVAVAISLMEQVLDIYKINLKQNIDSAPPGSARWLQDKVLKFQYIQDDPDPVIHAAYLSQGLLMINQQTYEVEYPVVNPALRIVTECSVVTSANKECMIKVAKGSPRVPLEDPEKAALVGYLNDVGYTGIKYTVFSVPADQVSIKGEVFYGGQYSAVIEQQVRDSLNNYLANLPFNGVIQVSTLEDVIQSVQGVLNVVLQHVYVLTYGVSQPLDLMNVGSQSVSTFAGYAIENTTSGMGFDTITFTAWDDSMVSA